MKRLTELLVSVSAKPSTVVHLGAGNCSEYQFYKSLAPNRIIFTEPDPERAGRAKSQFRDAPGVTIETCAIATENGQQTLNITNNRRFSSLLTPGRLCEFYPNVEVVDTAEVPTKTLETLCQGLGIDDEEDNLLVAELNGAEQEVFGSTAHNILQKFKWVFIRTSKEPIYTHTKANGVVPNIRQTMLDAHFLVLVFHEDTPPFINMVCIKSEAALANEKLSAELESAHARIRSLTSKSEALLQQLSEQKSAFEKRSKELAEMQQTLRINNKLMLKSNADLEDLQRQYRAVIQRQKEKDALLWQLKEKLSRASDIYQKLNLQQLVIDNDLLERERSDPEGSPDGEDKA